MQGNMIPGLGGGTETPSSPSSGSKHASPAVEYDDNAARPAKRFKADASPSATEEVPHDEGRHSNPDTDPAQETSIVEENSGQTETLARPLGSTESRAPVLRDVSGPNEESTDHADGERGTVDATAPTMNGTIDEKPGVSATNGTDGSTASIDEASSTKPLISQETKDWLQLDKDSNDVKPFRIDPAAIDAAKQAKPKKVEENDGRVKGVAPIKEEYLIRGSDDAASTDPRSAPKKVRGQNFNRRNGVSSKIKSLCSSIAMHSEFSAPSCKFGDKCKYTHDLRQYFESQSGEPATDDKSEVPEESQNEMPNGSVDEKAEDISKHDGESEGPTLADGPILDKCHNYDAFGWCSAGWRCHFIKAHMQVFKHPDGKEELVLTQRIKNDEDEPKMVDRPVVGEPPSLPPTVGNVVSREAKYQLQRNKVDFSKAQSYIQWLNEESKINETFHHRRKEQSLEGIEDLRAAFVDPPFLPSEKRRLYFGSDTPVLAPLTTQGNLPFRRLCVDLGCELTYSEMAYGGELLRGNMADWALMKAHESELSPPRDGPGRPAGYDRARDLKFGAQISANHHRVATKVASILNQWCPQLRVIDVNCGCPLDAVYKTGAGSGLLASTNKLERIIRGMNAVSGDIPVTAKIRTGVQTGRPTATKLIGQLAFGAREHRSRLGAPGCAAVTLHGRSREQRYTKKADWNYISECGAIVKSYNQELNDLTDTVREPDARTQANSSRQRMWFIGNGDCYSHEEYYDHIENAKVDSVMIGRGALIKPWIFEEIQAGQYLDKSSSERMEYMQTFVNYGLENWGSDAYGLNITRRFLLEWMSFSHRYVPVGILDVLPPDMNDRPPAYIGRDRFETKLASKNGSDWAELADHFLGPAPDEFSFTPKYKSNSYDAEG